MPADGRWDLTRRLKGLINFNVEAATDQVPINNCFAVAIDL